MTNSVIQKFLVFVFFGIVATGCALEDNPSVTAKKDVEKPTLTEVTAVSSPTSDSTPNYTFNSTEAGTITYGGSCSSSTTSATSGNNTITFVSLSDRTYSDCTITVTDEAGNVSNILTITSFTVAIPPTITEVTAVTTSTNDTTPIYTFSSTESGTITYGGSCSSSTTNAIIGSNAITLVSLIEGTYADCTITVTDTDGNVSNSLTISSFTVDTTTPTIEQVTVVTTPTNDSTPNYTFSSSESGTITYGGSCSSGTTSVISENNTITLNSLSDGTYSNCTITVTDTAGNVSNSITITSFIVDSTAATLAEVTSVTTPTKDNTPDYTFSSDEAGTITYGGSCSSSTTSATTDNNTITLVSLSDGTYSNCTITVTDNVSNSVTLNISSFIIDTVTPTIEQVTAVTNPTNDNTPNYTFSSSESGTITYGGSCSSSTTSANSGNNTITLTSLSDGTYSNCTIVVKDSAENDSNTLAITSFTVDATAPTVSSTYPSDGQAVKFISDNISLTFSEAMDNTSVTTNTSNTSCSGSIQVSSDNFSSCVQMSSSPSISNSNTTFTMTMNVDNITLGNTYKILVSTAVKDSLGNALNSQYILSAGFSYYGFIDLAAGEYHDCGVLDNGTVRCWGNGESAQLGNGITNSNYNSPANVTGLPLSKKVDANSKHTCAITTQDELYCWGKNNKGQIGNGTTGVTQNTPVKVLDNVSSVNLGHLHTCALLKSGIIKCWGNSGNWALGSSGGNTSTPRDVANITNATSVSAGNMNSCAILDNGTLQCWGGGSFSLLATSDASRTPINIISSDNISSFDNTSSVSVCTFHICNIDSAKVYCWGRGTGGHLGHGQNVDEQAVPVEVQVSNAVSLTVFGLGSCALLNDGTIKCWGGLLGNGTNSTSTVPVEVQGINNAIKIAAGAGSSSGNHVCALLDDGDIKCWGGASWASSTPVSVSGL